MTAWDMARLASKRPLRKKYKPCGPVGPTPDELVEAKWKRALAKSFEQMKLHPKYDAVICSPHDAERLKVLGLRIIAHVYARKGEWSLYETPPAFKPNSVVRGNPVERTLTTRLDLLDALSKVPGADRREALDLLLTGSCGQHPPHGQEAADAQAWLDSLRVEQAMQLQKQAKAHDQAHESAYQHGREYRFPVNPALSHGQTANIPGHAFQLKTPNIRYIPYEKVVLHAELRITDELYYVNPSDARVTGEDRDAYYSELRKQQLTPTQLAQFQRMQNGR